jgi:uncharacterized protein YaiE (UPF0345 family)
MKTLGIMSSGTDRFSTETPQTFATTPGKCRVKREGEQCWNESEAGEHFRVPGHSHVEIEVENLLDHVCHFG